MARRLIEVTSFRKEQGFCWIAALPETLLHGDTKGRAHESELMLFEDGKALGPACAQHDLIRNVGRGAFCHWGPDLWFSTSDNSRPPANGRRYCVVAIDREREIIKATADSTHGTAPVNYQPLDAARDAIEKDARYAIATAQSYVDCLPGGQSYLHNRSVLELGPGPNFGAVLVLLCWGADHVAIADRFLVPFNSIYHLPLYQRLRELLIEHDPALRLDPLLEVINSKRHNAAGLTAYASPLEVLAGAVDTPFDVTASNAVFEHLFDPRAAIRSLHKLTASGGIGLHQVDFRDHRDFSRPLEFLLDDERSFALLFDREHGETGGRLRPFQMEAMFREAGFSKVDFHPNLLAEKSYLDSLIPRLRSAVASPFSQTNVSDLQAVSGRFVVAK